MPVFFVNKENGESENCALSSLPVRLRMAPDQLHWCDVGFVRNADSQAHPGPDRSSVRPNRVCFNFNELCRWF